LKEKKLKRIVKRLTQGTIPLEGYQPPFNDLYYLILEKAHGDLRKYLQFLGAFDLAWCLRSLHHTAVAVSQLHRIGIAHQDIKPSNVLFFESDGSKLGDLGHAADPTISTINEMECPGDPTHSPPEKGYSDFGLTGFDRKRAADLFLLGSLIFFHFCDCSARHVIWPKVGNANRTTDFGADLPYYQKAFQEVLMEIEPEIQRKAGALSSDIMELIRILCEPDPIKRGFPSLPDSSQSRYSLEKVISKMDLLARRSELSLHELS